MEADQHNLTDESENLVFSYRTLRKIVGILGIALPLILIAGSFSWMDCRRLENSISDYYHTEMRNFFVVILSSYGLFLFAYKPKGEEWKIDRILSTIAGACALLTVFFPTKISEKDICGVCCCIDINRFDQTQIVHLSAALTFLLLLGVFSTFLFRRSHPGKTMSPNKIKRNRIYLVCGLLVFACCLALVTCFISKPMMAWAKEHQFIFWMETIALWAFGVSWLVKGEAILKD